MIATPAVVDVPIRIDEHGKIRVGETRVLLELVIHAFNGGETPESIIDSYSTLRLSDVYAVIAYYMAHRAEVDEYVRASDSRAEQIQRDIESGYTNESLALRARLRAAKTSYPSDSD